MLEGLSPEDFQVTGQRIAKAESELLVPCRPEKIICTGLNYRDAVLEDGVSFPTEPLLFLKPPSAIILSGETIRYPSMARDVTCEAELGIVIGKGGNKIPEHDAKQHIWGYIITNDMTARDLQRRDGQWTRAKSFDTFLPLGSEIVNEIDPQNLHITTLCNDVAVQDGNTQDMIFSIPKLVSYISNVMTLRPGDLILTGTPGGYGKPVGIGDRINIRIEKLGEIMNTISV